MTLMSKVSAHLSSGMWPVVSLGTEDAGGDGDGVEAAVGERDLVEHRADAGAVGDVRREADGRAAVGDAGAGDADAEAVLVGDFLRRGFGGVRVQVDADDVRAFLHEAVRGFLADAAAGADDDDDLPRQFLLGGHALQLRLLEQPVLDVEGFLLRQRDVFVDRLRAAHHFDGAVVELGGDARLAILSLPQAIMPRPGMRMTVGFGSRIAGRVRRVCTSS